MTRSPNTETNFFRLTGVELILAGAWTLFIALSQGLRTTTLLAMVVTMAGLAVLSAPFLSKSYLANLGSVLGGRFGRFASLSIPVLLSVFLFLRAPSIEALKIMGPILACIWLVGIEVLFFFQPPIEAKPEQSPSNNLSILSVLLGYGILLIPSRVFSLFDGAPWNTPLEFITATLILPFAFFFGKKMLSSKSITLLFTLLLIVKLGAFFFSPQAGLGVRVYFSQEALDSGAWQRTYESFPNSEYSQIMRLPYRSFYEFPIESINRHGFDRDSFWMTLEFSGVISLEEDERLIVLVQGASERRIELVDGATGTRLDVSTAKSIEELNADLFHEVPPYVGNAQLTGSLRFTSYGNGRFEPVILRSDGSVQSAFSQLWLSPSAAEFPASRFRLMQDLIALLVLAVVSFSLLAGLFAAFQIGTLDLPDFYLALTGFMLYYLSGVAAGPNIHLFLLASSLVLTLAKFLGFTLRAQPYSTEGYLFSLGLPILMMFLPLDIPSLQSVVPIPQYQDAMEYQMLARNIYVGGDAFLLQSPPWAYKVLFPYMAGLLHVLFGQSLSAQFFLNIWSAILSVALMVELAGYFGLSRRNSFIAASVFFLLLLLPVSFTYYFRFGLIEPVSIMTLLLVAHLAKERRFGAMFVVGVVTGMLRLNFAGAIFTAITFLAPPFTDGFAQAWGSFFQWLRSSWKRWAAYLVAIPFPSLLIAFIYRQFHSNYTLTHEMNDQTSVGSVLMSLASVVVGGDQEFLQNQIRKNPLDLVLITLPILFGLIVALISLVYRQRVFEKIDLRLSLFLVSMLPVYAVLKPIGYFPRYSWSFLPPALILLGLVLQNSFLRDNKALQETK